MGKIIECVPNFSEGRNQSVIEIIANSARNVEGSMVLGVEPDPDYNRTVLTIAGEPDSVIQAAFNVIKSSFENIDMRQHKGEHPRIGAVDVCPFIPIQNSSMDECVELARKLAKKVSDELSIPAFLYGYAAVSEDRKLLSDLRKGEYEGLEERYENNGPFMPDFGPQNWTENIAKFGAVVIGARDILVAYNVNLQESDAVVAKKVGTLIRSSGRLIKSSSGGKMRIPGMLNMVQGMGLPLESHGISQVSMNLRDINLTSLHVAYEAVKSIANDHSVETCGSELVGLVPLSTMLEAGQWYTEIENPTEQDLVNSAIKGLGLDNLGAFDAKSRIIEWALKEGN